MPQMMPLNWTILFMFFSSILLMFNIMNYFTTYHKSSINSNTKLMSKTMFWKW